jgi:transcriptional regulator with XRE-family HTH domain
MDIDFSKVLRENMRDIMKQKGFTQQWLSVQTDIPDATISRYLTGVHNPKIEYVARMAAAMGVSVDYMLGLSTSSIPDQPPSPEIRALIAGYERADPHTKKMIWMQLDLVLTDEEKALAPKQSNEQKSEAV